MTCSVLNIWLRNGEGGAKKGVMYDIRTGGARMRQRCIVDIMFERILGWRSRGLRIRESESEMETAVHVADSVAFLASCELRALFRTLG